MLPSQILFGHLLQGYDERYSTLGNDGYSDTTSLRPSIVEGNYLEHSRRYQMLRDNPMNFAGDDKQFDSKGEQGLADGGFDAIAVTRGRPHGVRHHRVSTREPIFPSPDL